MMKLLMMLKYACDDGPASNSPSKYLDEPIRSRPLHVHEIEAAKPQMKRDSAHILWVDDEPNVLGVGREMLCHLGYTVVTAPGAKEALDIFQIDPHGFDAVITDENMPGLTGRELMEKMFALRPDLPVILSTGFGEDPVENTRAGHNPLVTVEKPFKLEELAAAVTLALGRR